ncbi:hypothetical protein KHA80_12210 [Anaerobacillus sp. HL2]|nr:hypothetical protein KHA80_12210 [Anaerobacillus sp. HL2]
MRGMELLSFSKSEIWKQQDYEENEMYLLPGMLVLQLGRWGGSLDGF